jgi:hypothetical protein
MITETRLITDIHPFVQTALRAITRAESQGRLPARFTGFGPEIWRAFRNELTQADLVALSIQDAGATMPIPFNPMLWWPDWPNWALRTLPLNEVQQWLAEAMEEVNQPEAEYLHRQAQVLDLILPTTEELASLPTPAAHEKWLELPGTAGWVAYSLCARPDAELYLWENFTILCESPQEMLFAGLLAWELHAPPRQALPIHLDPALAETLHSGQSYRQVVARHDLHGHRALHFLQTANAEPLWI